MATEALIDALFRWRDRSPNRPFNSFADARQVSADVSRMLEYNKFELTHYNHDPDTIFTGEDRMLLTTRRDLVPKVNGVYARRFLDILRDDKDLTALDPGSPDDIAGGQQDWRDDPTGETVLPNKLNTVVRELAHYLEQRNWPISAGSSFASKYYADIEGLDPAVRKARIAQLAVNIIDYVRAKESRLSFVPPLFYGVDGEDRYTMHAIHAVGAPGSCSGVARAPYITEMALHVAADFVLRPIGADAAPEGWPMQDGTPVPLYPCTFKTELFLPAGYQVVDLAGMAGVELVPVKTLPLTEGKPRCWFLSFSETQDASRHYYALSPASGAMIPLADHATAALPLLQDEIAGSSRLEPGRYLTVTKVLYRAEAWPDAATAGMRAVLRQGTTGVDGLLAAPLARWAPVSMAPQSEPVEYAIGDPAAVTAGSMPSIETDDPRACVSKRDWMPNRGGTNSFGAVNSVSTLGRAPTLTGIPQQDTDDGLLSGASVYMPPPKDAGSNADGENTDKGLVTSLGELGLVFTGNDAIGASTSWRSLRLQPNHEPTAGTLPDWALLDLFAVLNVTTSKVKEPGPLYTPHGTSVGGRVNVNSRVAPFEMERASAPRAAFTGASALLQKNDAAVIGRNIYNHTLATGANPGKVYGTEVYELAGEVCEIAGVADGGERREELVREVISLLTARTGVFGFYTIGQSLKQSGGGVVVTGEQRQQAIVERYLDRNGTADPEDDAVRFRTVYFRNLSP